MKIGSICIIALLVAGCSTRPEVDLTRYANPAEVAPYNALGPASIEGQAFLRQRGGGVVTCAGEKVELVPWIPIVQKGLEAWKAGRAPTSSVQISAEYPNSHRTTSATLKETFRSTTYTRESGFWQL